MQRVSDTTQIKTLLAFRCQIGTMLSSQTSYNSNQTVGTVAKLEVIRIIAHLTVGVFTVAEKFTTDWIYRIVSYFVPPSLPMDHPVYMTCSPSHLARVKKGFRIIWSKSAPYLPYGGYVYPLSINVSNTVQGSSCP